VSSIHKIKLSFILFAVSTALGECGWIVFSNPHIGSQIVLSILGVAVAWYSWTFYMIAKDKEFSILFAGCVAIYGYLLLQSYAAHWYEFIAMSDPMAINDGSDGKYRTFLYFSSITQTTVGYGDILPRSAFARFAVIVHVTLAKIYDVANFGLLGSLIANRVIAIRT
jgi:hypothetical protein